MALILDTGIIYAYYDCNDDWHLRARRLIEAERRGLILPAAVIPEVDHLLRHRIGLASALMFYRGIVQGSYFLAELPQAGHARVSDLNQQFRDLDLGFVDAAIVATAEHLGFSRIATTDRRHFVPLARALSFDLLP